ncbi:stalk domain-containing protein [Paenibacillus sp. GCM10023248]|uniref:stalk domain-containing protein n=1 Tax=Bacillales TaxID=1385 RepID=UPI0023780995|nr:MULTISPECIES: stalk domain-containing protein [Bacillales]MDD9267265.1 stalk domain-containing protein [Paenibacillus sp. MAHUQ-63]MDR6881479.1 hypothetical protein [Bacillus sp. 3255]
MHKKSLNKIALLTCALFVTVISTTNADNLDKIIKSPVTLWLNDKEHSLSNEFDLYNINGSTYVPLRDIVEQLGGAVYYDSKSSNISIHLPKASEKYSSTSSIHNFDDFTLELHSSKSSYEENENMNIWASLTYRGAEKIDFIHGSPALSFSITDQDGVKEGGYTTASAIKTEFDTGNQVTSDFPLRTILEYNYRKSGKPDYNLFLANPDSDPSYLPPGDYSIKVNASFLKGEGIVNQKNANAEIKITVK